MNDDTTYEIIHCPNPGELFEAVSGRIDQGWWPLGTPFVRGERFIEPTVLERTQSEPLELATAES